MLIGELSRRTGVSRRLLRYYEDQGLLQAARGHNGYRSYGEDAVAVVGRIRFLLDAGLTTEVIQAVLPCVEQDAFDTGIDWCGELRDLLAGELAALDERLNCLQERRTSLAGLLGQS
ncbi:MerR family transcriptional regulator [Streptomyces albidoflavus]|uniref:MerR family transcriptional regulator n=1 Tax=Streptomyces TaxID=1883 RepID=UPI00063E8C55|nr:MerR family transcriptional regulator [Streptomyces sp. KE1]KLJ01198.1 MerR family transcriptional regulator [Streptomyces sp. KE1]